MKDIHIGEIIRQKLDESKIPYSEFARMIHCERQSLYYLFKCKSIDTDRLLMISKALDYDFIRHLYTDSTPDTPLPEKALVIDIDANQLENLDKIILNIKHPTPSK